MVLKIVAQCSYHYLIYLANTLILICWEWAILAIFLGLDLDKENRTVQPCLTGIQSFAGYLLFSVETQTTIGYGGRSVTHHCPEAILLLCAQTVTGICICGVLVSIVYTKMSSPQKLNSMDSFSKHAVMVRNTISQRSYRYLIDLANTLISTLWEWALLAVCLVFLSTWMLFACLWLLVARINGDLDKENRTIQPCLTGIQSFAGYLLFSVETQTTIGYGSRSVTHHCPEAIFLLCVQTVTGICICGVLVSIVYTKMSSPQKLNSMDSFS